MEQEKLCLQPGDKVRVTRDIGRFDMDRPYEMHLIGTQGSIGILVSPEEYRTYHRQRLKKHGTREAELADYEDLYLGAKRTMEKCTRYPIRFEKVMPPSEAADLVLCKEGEIELLDVFVLEKIE